MVARGPLAGALTGFITILTGVFVIPLVPYLNALSLKREELIQALGLSFLTAGGGARARAGAGRRVAAVAGRRFGVCAGACRPRHVRGSMGGKLAHPAMFVRIFAVGLLLIGLHLALRNLM